MRDRKRTLAEIRDYATEEGVQEVIQHLTAVSRETDASAMDVYLGLAIAVAGYIKAIGGSKEEFTGMLDELHAGARGGKVFVLLDTCDGDCGCDGNDPNGLN